MLGYGVGQVDKAGDGLEVVVAGSSDSFLRTRSPSVLPFLSGFQARHRRHGPDLRTREWPGARVLSGVGRGGVDVRQKWVGRRQDVGCR